MNDLNFTEEDKQKFVDFLNMVSKHAKFKLDTEQVIMYFKLIAHMQQKIIPKIESNIFEVKRVVEAPQVTQEPKAKGKK